MNYSRRDFGRFALASLPAAAGLTLPSRVFGAPDSRINGVQIGMITYSFRQGVAKDQIIPGMAKIGLSEAELMSGDAEALAGAPQVAMGGFGGGRGRGRGPVADAPNGCPANTPSGQASIAAAAGGEGRGGGRGRGPLTPEQQEAANKLKAWRASATESTWKGVRKQFNDAGIDVQILCYNMGMATADDEIEYAFQMAKALGVRAISCSSTVSFAKRVAPFADKHKIVWAGHGHADIYDPEQFAKPETFEHIMTFSKYIGVNLDIGHYTAAGYDPVSFIEKHHARITNLHVKDRKKPDKCGASANLAFGTGDTPIKEVLLLMKKRKLKFPANIELEYQIPEGSDPVAEVAKCYKFCKDILA